MLAMLHSAFHSPSSRSSSGIGFSSNSSGTAGFAASSSTRQLKASQLSSRLKKRPGPAVSAKGSSTGAGKGERRKSAWVMDGHMPRIL